MNKQKLGKKNFLEVVIAIAITMSFIIPASSTFEHSFADTIIGIEPSLQKVKKGETFAVSIYIVPSEPVICVNIGNLSFNPSLIHANEVTKGNFFDPYETFTPGIINNTDGIIEGIEGTTTLSNATTDTGIFCNISFTAQDEIGTSVLDIEDVVVTNLSGSTISSMVNNGSVTIVAWSVMLDFSETSGKNDYVVFGEIPDANDGVPADCYDMPKPPKPPEPPYIRAWFDDGLPTPYNFLWEDYRSYPDTYKVWDLYVQWECSSSNPTNITISWDTGGFYDCEYASVVLWMYDPFDEEWDFAADMVTENEYTYAPRYFVSIWLKDRFQIFTIFDTTPPEITNTMLTPSYPLDTDVPFGWENISCNITDNVAVNYVRIIVTYPDTTVEYPMINIPGTDVYYYNTTFTDAGYYEYHIWAADLVLNNATSSPETFVLPMNEDVDMNGQTYFNDLMSVIWMYGDTGSNGWVREDIDNNGEVYFNDLMNVIWYYGEWWK